jgi:membrane-bound lytic murein transglycosylase D
MSNLTLFVFTIALLTAIAASGAPASAAADEAAPPANPDSAPVDPEGAEAANQPTEQPDPATVTTVETAPGPELVEEPMPPVEALVGPPEEADDDDYGVVVNDRVQFFMDRYTGSRREIIGVWLNRSPRYLTMIREAFRAQGLPEDLCFVAMIESGFNPRAVSRVGAKGLWQFMAPTARSYGLRVDKWVDERLDPVKSTHAAAAHMRDLYRQFGSWALVKAAYNAGETKVIRAIQGTGTNDFWELARSRYLRQETKDFVPAIHAATLIGRDPARYGFEPEPVETMITASVAVPPRTSLKTLSSRAGISLEVLRDLNPVLIRAMTPPGPPYPVIVPEGSVERIEAALAPPRGIHIVKPNESVSVIAKRYGATVAEVLRWNRLDERSVIRPGDQLRVFGPNVTAERGKTTSLR